MNIYEKMRFLAMGGKNAYLHTTKENKMTTKLQDFLDKVYYSNPNFYKKFH